MHGEKIIKMKGFDKNKIDTYIFHSPCPDGFGAAFVGRLYFESINSDEPIDFVGMHPNDKAPSVKGKNVLIVDISWSLEETERMYSEANSLFIIDHHHSAEKEIGHLGYVEFDMKRSGVIMAWNYFFPGMNIPTFLWYIGLKDIWQHKCTDV